MLRSVKDRKLGRAMFDNTFSRDKADKKRKIILFGPDITLKRYLERIQIYINERISQAG